MLAWRRPAVQVWDKTAVLSWRWGKGKPGVKEPGYMPMTDGQFDHLKKMLRHALADGMEHVWIDWTCVPQYASDTSLTMAEVSRSRLYYARAKAVLILPALKPLEETGGNGSMSITRALLGRIQRAMRAADASGRAHSFTINGQPPWAFTQKLVETLKNRNEHASYEYFGRVWTLVERMARYGRKEKLCQWLPVDMWLGMCLDVLLTACQEGSSTASDTEVYWSKLFSKEMRDRQQELLGKLRVAMSTKVMDDVVALADDLASFLVDSVQVWATTSLEEEEQPSKEWLKEYLPGHSADGPLATYKAWNTRDAIFSVVNYFCEHTLH